MESLITLGYWAGKPFSLGLESLITLGVWAGKPFGSLFFQLVLQEALGAIASTIGRSLPKPSGIGRTTSFGRTLFQAYIFFDMFVLGLDSLLIFWKKKVWGWIAFLLFNTGLDSLFFHWRRFRAG